MTILRSMRNFSAMNIVASILLFVTAIAAAIIANSPLAPAYQEFLSHELHFLDRKFQSAFTWRSESDYD